MLTPVEAVPSSAFSTKKVMMKCSCGRSKLVTWKSYTAGSSKTCGLCKRDKYQLSSIMGLKFGRLMMKPGQELVSAKGGDKVIWECDCGNSKSICIKSVVDGYTKSCGCYQKKTGGQICKHTEKAATDWLRGIPALYDDGHLPDKWSKGSSRVFKFKCQCGSLYSLRFNKYKISSKCKACKRIPEGLLGHEYGQLTIMEDKAGMALNSVIKVRCKCGKECYKPFYDVMSGNTSTCGRCSEVTLAAQYGRLRVLEGPEFLRPFSATLVKVVCSCGSVTEKRFTALHNGLTTSCGDCSANILPWWNNKPAISSLDDYDLDKLQKYFDGYSLTPLQSAETLKSYINVRCNLCNGVFKTQLGWIQRSRIVSCGCICHKISKPVIQIKDWLESLGLAAQLNHKSNGYEYDIKVNDLFIEHHGLRYHSTALHDGIDRHRVDVKKHTNAELTKHGYLMFYEDEWRDKQQICKSIILNRLGLNDRIRIRPQQCRIELVNGHDASKFYEANHYIGSVGCKYHVGVHYDGRLIGLMGIRKPSRQNSGEYEIARMVGSSQYSVPGLWSYLIRKFIKKTLSGKLVTYCDVRLFSGKTYERMGFSKAGKVKPDYYWVLNNKRHHKSALRKTDEERATGLTETVLRSAQGYHKIYDLGKTKWTLDL